MKARKKTAKSHPLFTIGYEQAKPAAVLNELKQAKIGYLHLQKLGTPAEGRAAARTGDTDALWRIYDKHIKKPDAQEELGELVALIKSGKRIALLCYCRDPMTCHRSRIVANVKKRTRVNVDDLVPPLF